MSQTKEQIFLNKALEYKKKYDDCAWWKFRKRARLYRSWQSALELMIKYSE